MKHYDYIFTGSGLSALMTVYKMVISGKFDDKSILLLDQNPKKDNDRTWCFWDDGTTFPSLVSQTWDCVLFKNESFERKLDLAPDSYNMIKGIDFYDFVFKAISKEKKITFLHEKVTGFKDGLVKTESENFTCDKIINSIFDPEIIKFQNKYPLLQQHFIGWFIKCKEPVFNPNCATFMDFSVEQKGNTRFMYVLPFSKNEALVEYTLFSKDLLLTEEYETEISNYVQKLGITEYEIVEKEHGNIPMTSYPFWKHNTKNTIHIGSAGGWTKASTGFTFKNSVKKSKALVEFLSHGSDFRNFHTKNKFWYYDLLLLDILSRKNELGFSIFSSLFKKGKPDLILRFLDEETTLTEDIKIILKCPKTPFLQALLKRIF